MSLTLEGQTLFATDQKLVDVIVEERHTRDCHRAGLAVLEVKTLLKHREREREREGEKGEKGEREGKDKFCSISAKNPKNYFV